MRVSGGTQMPEGVSFELTSEGRCPALTMSLGLGAWIAMELEDKPQPIVTATYTFDLSKQSDRDAYVAAVRSTLPSIKPRTP